MAAQKLEGVSIAMCVYDILGGYVQEKDVSRIFSSAAVPSKLSFDELIDQYGRNYWGSRSDRSGEAGREIATRLFTEGKVLFTGTVQDCSDRHWQVISIVSPLNLAARRKDHNALANGVSLENAKMKTLRLKPAGS